MKLITTEDERERDEALELDAQTAGEIARCLVESKRRRGPPLPCPRKLFLWLCSAGMMVETDQAIWVAKGEACRRSDGPSSSRLIEMSWRRLWRF
jgi:hypothetical protein